ncbi:thioredoxin family protein [Larkinella soli]|uniref:thioredoxin family protein n=1 Tax=Larkinella soli TaxID=1770527 RepID=UPI000FFB8912|nr:thioredoxin domain-containing protein [Larkinella soli]
MNTQSKKAVYATDHNWDELMAKGGLLVVDFGADWCGPCRRMEPIINELASDLDGTATVATFDVESNPVITSRFNVRNLPTILFFRDGELVHRRIGLTPKHLLAQDVSGLLATTAVL